MTRQQSLLGLLALAVLVAVAAWLALADGTQPAAPNAAASRRDTSAPEPVAAAAPPAPMPGASVATAVQVRAGSALPASIQTAAAPNQDARDFTARQDLQAMLRRYPSEPGGALALQFVVRGCLAAHAAKAQPVDAEGPHNTLWAQHVQAVVSSCAALASDPRGWAAAAKGALKADPLDPLSAALKRRLSQGGRMNESDRQLIQSAAWEPWVYEAIVEPTVLSWFDGKAYDSDDSGTGFVTSHTALGMATLLAQCDHGFPCGAGSWAAAGLCVSQPQVCGMGVEEGVRKLVEESFDPSPTAWQDLQQLRHRVGAALKAKQIEKFTPPA